MLCIHSFYPKSSTSGPVKFSHFVGVHLKKENQYSIVEEQGRVRNGAAFFASEEYFLKHLLPKNP